MNIPNKAVEAVINQAKIVGVSMDASDAYFIAQAVVNALLTD